MKFITIIGIGLIGSSIARIVKSIDSNIQINIVDNSKENLEQCRLLKLGNIFNSEINVKIEESDLIFVCTPISSYEQIFNILNKFELSKAIISDVGSSKVKVIELAQKILKNIPDLGICELTRSDIVRHPLVQRIIEAYQDHREPKA